MNIISIWNKLNILLIKTYHWSTNIYYAIPSKKVSNSIIIYPVDLYKYKLSLYSYLVKSSSEIFGYLFSYFNNFSLLWSLFKNIFSSAYLPFLFGFIISINKYQFSSNSYTIKEYACAPIKL